MKKLGVLVIGRKRPGFDQEWNQTIRDRCGKMLAAAGFEAVGADAPVVDDATIATTIARIRAAGCDALIVLQPSLGHGQLSLAVMQQWGLPVVLWATPERHDSEKVSSCSLVAQHLWASILRQVKYPFEFVYGDPHSDATRAEITRAVSICRAKVQLSRSKLGSIGGNAPGFLAMAPDTFVMKEQLGVQLAMLSLADFIERVRNIDDAAVKSDLDRVRAMKLPMREVTADDLTTQSRYYVALRQVIAEEALDAMSMQEWPELPNHLGQWPYLAMARLADDGFPIAMEGDADSAILCLLANQLGMGLGFITDWLEHDEKTITMWHAGTAPASMCAPLGFEGGPTLARHFNVTKPTVLDGSLKVDQPVTMARLWRCDGRYHMTAFEGRTIPPKRKVTGNSAAIEVDGGGVPLWFDTLCHAGFPHHPVVFFGRHRELLRRMARMMDVNWLAKP
jgi:L-fucose isomerase-like protein